MGRNLQKRIVIIGAGASGLTAALALKDRGYTNVVVFEKEDRVGGKSHTVMHEGTPYDMGSLVFSRGDQTARLADRFGVPYASFTAKDFYFSGGRYMDPVAFARRSHSPLAILRSLHGLRRIIARNRLDEPGYGDADPALFQNFSAFVKERRLEAAAEAFRPAISGLGYGYYETTPALYMLKIMASMMEGSLLRQLVSQQRDVCYFPGGWSALWGKAAAGLDVRTRARIGAVRRPPEGGVHVTVDGATDRFDALLLAAPLQRADVYLDVSTEEADLLRRVRTCRMVTTLVEGSASLSTAFLADNARPERIGHVIGVECYVPQTRCLVLFQIVPNGMAQEEIERLQEEDLRTMGCAVRRRIVRKEWEYFAHVSSDDLADGFHPKWNALQGTRATFYLGNIMNFETVDHCMQFADHIVATRF